MVLLVFTGPQMNLFMWIWFKFESKISHKIVVASSSIWRSEQLVQTLAYNLSLVEALQWSKLQYVRDSHGDQSTSAATVLQIVKRFVRLLYAQPFNYIEPCWKLIHNWFAGLCTILQKREHQWRIQLVGVSFSVCLFLVVVVVRLLLCSKPDFPNTTGIIFASTHTIQWIVEWSTN